MVVREADGWNGSRQIDAIFSRPFHGLHPRILGIPAMNRWAIFSRPRKARTGSKFFSCKATQVSRIRNQDPGIRTQDSGLGTQDSSFLAGGEGCIEDLLRVARIRLGLKVGNETLGNAVCGI